MILHMFRLMFSHTLSSAYYMLFLGAMTRIQAKDPFLDMFMFCSKVLSVQLITVRLLTALRQTICIYAQCTI